VPGLGCGSFTLHCALTHYTSNLIVFIAALENSSPYSGCIIDGVLNLYLDRAHLAFELLRESGFVQWHSTPKPTKAPVVAPYRRTTIGQP
jgi:hypothetical protein